jgi:hypothetical protein
MSIRGRIAMGSHFWCMFLEAVARGTPDARLTEAARAALERLKEWSHP